MLSPKISPIIEYSRDIHSLDAKEWDNFILCNPHGNVFQSPGFCRAMNGANGRECLGVYARRGGLLVGVMTVVVQREISGPLGSLASRAIVHGGPVVDNDDPEIAAQLIKLIVVVAKSKAVYTQVRNLYDVRKFDSFFRASKFVFQDHLNIIVDLEKPEETLWHEVHPKRRNEIRRASREGTQFEVKSTLEALEPSYKILNNVYQKAKLPLPAQKYFEKCFSELGPNIFRIFTAVLDSRIIGTMYALCYKDVIYDWYAGAESNFLKYYPNDLIPWEVFLWGKKNGYKYFDFGGAGRSGVKYGVREYKKKFGGNIVSLGRYEKINKPVIWKISRTGFPVWQFIRSMFKIQ